MNRAIQVRQLRKCYGHQSILEDLSFSIPAGAVSLYLGPNGAGKTTTFRILAGLVQPDAGELEILGGPPRHELRQQMAVTLEEPRFYPHLSGLDNLRIVAQARQIGGRAWPIESLKRVGLNKAAHRPFRTYSQGMRQRLYLAACLLPGLRLLLLDEPTNGLDVEGRQELWHLLSTLRDDGVALMISTHQVLETERFADYIVMLHQGRCAFAGDYTELMAQRRFVVRVDDAATACQQLITYGAVGLPGQRNEILLTASEEDLPRIRHALEAQGGHLLGSRHEDLEELYWRLKDAS